MKQKQRSTLAKNNNIKDESIDGSHLMFLEKKESQLPVSLESCQTIGGNKIIAWGADNMYPQWLNYLRYTNSMHGGIINGKIFYTVSGGLKYTPATNDPLEMAQWNSFFENGKSDFNLNELLEQISGDYETFNQYYIKCYFSVDFSKVEKMELIDVETVRKIEDSTDIYVSNDWGNSYNFKGKKIPLSNLKLLNSKPVENEKRPREFYLSFEDRTKQFKDKKSNYVSKRIYPLPNYNGALRSICTGIEIDEFQNSEIVNNFALGTVINLNNGVPRNKTDRDDLKKEIRKAATGTSNTGGIWVNFSNGKEREATITSMNGNNLAGRYIEVEKGTQKNILRAHSCTVPILFGVKEEGSLGNNTELLSGYAIMNSNYFRQRRRNCLSLIRYVAEKYNGLKGKIELNEPVIELPDEKPKEPTVMIQNGKFTSEEEKETIKTRLLKQLEFAGVPKSSKTIIHSVEYGQSDDIIKNFQREHFAELTNKQQQVLNLISGENDFDAIKQAMDINASTLSKIYSQLTELGYLNASGELTTDGAKQVAKSDISKMEILYSYEKRADVDGPTLIDTSRDFCIKLIQLDRLYTREEIERISAVEGYDVFTHTGGWYHDPKDGKNKNRCRHAWFQNVVFKN